MRPLHILSALLVASLGSGCASRSLTQAQCTAGDWETVGYRDAQNGLARTSLLAHQDACGKFGIVPDRTQYLRGWDDGIGTYCRADRAFALGEQGAGHHDVCPEPLREPFVAAYEEGRELHLARREVHRLEHAVSRGRERMQRIDARVLDLAAAQVDTELTQAQRVELFAQTKNLLDEKKRIEHELPELELQLEHALARLDRLPARHRL